MWIVKINVKTLYLKLANLLIKNMDSNILLQFSYQTVASEVNG